MGMTDAGEDALRQKVAEIFDAPAYDAKVVSLDGTVMGEGTIVCNVHDGVPHIKGDIEITAPRGRYSGVELYDPSGAHFFTVGLMYTSMYAEHGDTICLDTDILIE